MAQIFWLFLLWLFPKTVLSSELQVNTGIANKITLFLEFLLTPLVNFLAFLFFGR